MLVMYLCLLFVDIYFFFFWLLVASYFLFYTYAISHILRWRIATLIHVVFVLVMRC